jgi:Xaa-Pro aminopeptidase
MRARRDALARVLEAAGVGHAVLYGADRSGSAVAWLTGWPVTREAAVVFTPGERDVLFVQFYNHVPNARLLAPDADVRWGGPSTLDRAVEVLLERGARRRRAGFVGALAYDGGLRLAAALGEPVDLNPAYTRLRMVKSREEIEWLRTGVRLTDLGVGSLVGGARRGMDEAALGDLVERGYSGLGGTTHIHYFGIASMEAPDLCVPAQWPSGRRLSGGDALLCEVSASWWGYAGQALRTFTVGDPTPLYRDLHAAADAAFDAICAAIRPGAHASELVEAASVIEDAGFTIRDDLVHGFVGGYLPPVLGSKSRKLDDAPDVTLEAGMALVVQPNVVTADEAAGVQTGELVLVGEGGAERLHSLPRGVLRLD